TTGSPERGYQSVLTTSENDTLNNTIIYRCTATTLGYYSFSDTTILVEAVFSSQGGFVTTSTSVATNIQTISSTFITNPSITPPTQKTISPNTTVFIPGTDIISTESLTNSYVMMTMSTESQAQSTTKQASGITTTSTATTVATNQTVNASIATTNVYSITLTTLTAASSAMIKSYCIVMSTRANTLKITKRTSTNMELTTSTAATMTPTIMTKRANAPTTTATAIVSTTTSGTSRTTMVPSETTMVPSETTMEPTITPSETIMAPSETTMAPTVKPTGTDTTATYGVPVPSPIDPDLEGGGGMKQILISTGTAVLVLVTFVFICSIILYKRKDKTKRKSQSKYQKSSSKRLERLERHELRERGWRDDDGSDYMWPLFTAEIPVRSDIPVSEFPDYVIDMTVENQHDTSKLAIEYQQLSSVPTLSYEVACLPQNTNLNRFRNIYPYDDSRVPLKEIPGELGSDYINASFVSGYCGNRYIAAQAPLNETIDHFWRMVWEYEIEAIVMLTKCVEMTREKSAQYWPESLSETITPGDRLSVTLSSSTPYAEYHVRKLLVKHLTESDKSVTVTQFHYTAWPDHGVPDNVMSVIRFIRHVRKLFPAASQDQPLLVHCSAGVGRTGTFITLDMMMQQMKAEATLSVCQCVRNLRTQRMKMVQTPVTTFNDTCLSCDCV
ncbi:Receptor-type tyrosine-protein phosphatase H, partial [Geodia barretti]